MRVLVVTNTYPPADISGVGSLAEELLAGLGGSIRIEVLTRVAPAGARGVVATGGPKLLFPLLAALRALPRLRTTDVVQVNESDGVLVALAARLLRRLGLAPPRVAATFQVSYASEAREVRPVRARGRVVSRPTRSELVFRRLRAPLLYAAGRLTARLADGVAACSRFTAAELERDYALARERVRVIPNGIRPAVAAPADLESRSSPPPALPHASSPAPASPPASTRPPGAALALYAGRLRTRKAVAVLLEALALPDARDVALVVAGDGEQLEALRAQARALGLGERVRFLGKVPRGALAAEYAAADLFVLPSTYEGFPVAVLEAMAAGLPVVATAVAGLPEALVDGVEGRLVPAEDEAALARALGELARDPQARRRMGEAARRAVEARFSIARVGAEYVALWRELLPVPRRAGA